MIDSVLKGNGNSRFLKSAVPAGTSWADALAMLQAGTFPIDFNGINTEGFQQIGTPLNKANLLKDATAAQIGLPPSTTPDGMFQALGNTGELHVWRKTTVTPAGTTTTYPVSTNPNAYQEGSDAKPAGYTLGEVVSGNKAVTNLTSVSTNVKWGYGDVLVVSDDGTISISNPSTRYLQGNEVNSATYAQQLLGHFVTCAQAGTGFAQNVIYYIPADAQITRTKHIVYIDRYQPVTGYAAIPAGTTIEYLGKLGDKARVQVLSYVGTGTYGSSNPNSLTFDFVPKMVIISSAPVNNSYVYIAIMVPDAGIYSVVISTVFEYESRTPGGSGTVTKNNKTITFHSGSENIQLNRSGIKYTAVAIG